MGSASAVRTNLKTQEQMDKYVSSVAENAGNKISSTIGTAEGSREGKELAKASQIQALKRQGFSEEEAKKIANKTDYIEEMARKENKEKIEGFALQASGKMDKTAEAQTDMVKPKDQKTMENLAEMSAEAKTKKYEKTTRISSRSSRI